MSVRFPIRFFIAALLLAVAALSQTNDALAQAGRPVRGPVLPFENDFAQRRKDKVALQFNDHIATVPGSRIREVPTVNGRMGDRVVVGEGVWIHFPVGYLMTATYQFDKMRPKANASGASTVAELEPNPDYVLVKRFDSELGPVCAATEDKTNKTRVEFRLKPGTKLMSLVIDQPGRWDGIAKDTSRSYVLFTGIEERYVVNEALGRKLLTHCKSGAKDVNVAFDANSSVNLAMMIGTDASQGTPR